MVDYSLDRKHVDGIGEDWGFWGLPSNNVLELTSSRESEKALLQKGNNFFNGCPLNAGNSTPTCDNLQISLGKKKNVSTNMFVLGELLSDDSKLHPAKHVD